MAYVPNSGSVVAFQGNPSVLQATVGLMSTNASVITVGTAVANQSVSGTVQADIRGSVAAVIIGGSIAASFTPPANQSVSGTVQSEQTGTRITSVISSTPSSMLVGASIIGLTPVNVSNFPTTQNISGSVVAFQGTPEWTVKSSITGGIFPISGSVAAVVTNFPTSQNVSGSVVAFQGTSEWTVKSSISGGIFPISGSVAATITNTNLNVSGSVAAFQAGTRVTSLVSTVPSSVIVGASIFGQLPAGTAPLGSVATLQGTNPWMVNPGNSSIIAVIQAPSFVGTYAEDAAHTTADKGVFILGVRNDTVASFVSANTEYNAFAHDSAGRVLGKPFAAEEARVEGYHSVVSGSVTTLVAAAGAGLRNYITDLWFANTGASTTLVTLKDGLGSILGYTVAPAGGGSNLPGLQTPIRTGANASFDFQATTSTSVLYATVKGFKAP